MEFRITLLSKSKVLLGMLVAGCDLDYFFFYQQK